MTADNINVVVSGSGNMGQEVLAGVAAADGMTPVGVIEKLSQEESFPVPGGGSVPMSSDPAALLDSVDAHVIVDFTNLDWTPTVAAAALERGVRLVIGTSGLPEEWVNDLDVQCRKAEVGAVVAANFAIGAVLMTHMAKLAGTFFDSAEIIELHHDGKVDAPSGTALATAREMAEARGKPFDRNVPDTETLAGTRAADIDGITIHSVRLPGLVAHQEVLFGGLGQTLSIRHDTTGRASFIPGVLLAVREVVQRKALVRGLADLVGLE